ncbi:MAG: hypothetical protein ACOCWG_04825, partial [bacterium]
MNTHPQTSETKTGGKDTKNQSDSVKSIESYGREQQLLINRLRQFIDSRWDTRFNLITQGVDIKEVDSDKFEAIDDYFFNTILLEARKTGIRVSKELLTQYLNSIETKRVNPIKEAIANYIKSYPNPDGYIDKLAHTVITSNHNKWSLYFKKWLVGLV